jgi:hypothetical protein
MSVIPGSISLDWVVAEVPIPAPAVTIQVFLFQAEADGFRGGPFKMAATRPTNLQQGKLRYTTKNIVHVRMPAQRFIIFRLRGTGRP